MEKKQKIALILNIVIFLLAVIGSIFCFGEIYLVYTKPLDHGIRLLKFFTVQSNVLAGIVSLVYIIFLLRNKKTNKPIPTFVNILKFIATIDLIITFLVVALFLGFIVEEGYFSLYVNANFFFHLAIPVLNFISFIWYEERPKFKFCYTAFGLIHLVLYSVFYLIVVLTHYQDGAVPLFYDWYGFAQLGLGMAFVCAIVVLGLGYLVAFLLYKINNKKVASIDKLKEPKPTIKEKEKTNNKSLSSRGKQKNIQKLKDFQEFSEDEEQDYNSVTKNPYEYPDITKDYEYDSLEFDELMDLSEDEDDEM